MNTSGSGRDARARATDGSRAAEASVLRKSEPSRETIFRSKGSLANTLANDLVEGMIPKSRQSSSATMTSIP